MARLSSLSSSQSVSFRHGTNVEFNAPGFGNGGTAEAGGVAAPPSGLDVYNLQTVTSNKNNRDFSNPMYDAVQSGTTQDPSGGGVANGAGVYFLYFLPFLKVFTYEFIFRLNRIVRDTE